jgi:glycosyltransferase involved in cell wall biosynthesis
MRILHVYRTYFPDTQGGLEEVIRQICSGTMALGAECRVLTTTKDRKNLRVVDFEGVKVFRVPELFELASCNVSASAFRAFRELGAWADVIHFHFPWPFADLLNQFIVHNKPTIITYHSDIVRQKFLRWLYTPLMHSFLRSADRVVCTSPNYFATSNSLLPFEHKVDVIPIGLDSDSYPSVTKALEESIASKFGRDFFLFVGVLRYYKGLHILLDAVKDAPFDVVIVGSGQTEASLKKQAQELGLTNVVFTGHVDDEIKVALFKLSRAIVFPSYLRSEAFGVTLLEGAMHSKPLVSTEVGSGTSHVNVHGKTGIVVAPGSPRSLRRAMDQLYERPEIARLMGQRARKRFENLFTGDLMASRYWKLYCDVTNFDIEEGSSNQPSEL